MTSRRALAALLSVIALACGAVVAACGDAVVGGTCAPGYAACGGACKPIAACADARDDADANDALADDADAIVSDATDGNVGDGNAGDGRGDATGGDADDASGDANESGIGDADAGDAGAASDGCPAPPYTTAAHCGACDVACAGATPVCKQAADAGVWTCAPLCDVGKTYCSGTCVDLDIDPMNCGACGTWCPTGLCNAGSCRGARAGHVVAIGHDYAGVAPTAAAAQVLTNAAFLPTRNPVRILAWMQWADAGAVASVHAILDAGAASSGRTYTLTPSPTQADFLSKLSIDAYDEVLVYDQPHASTGDLAAAGAAMGPDFSSFSATGGVVITLDGGGGVGEMPAFLSASALLDTTSHSTVTFDELEVSGPGDAVGIGVLSPYQAPSKSVSFTLATPPGSTKFVVVDDVATKAPVVVHRVVFQ